MFTVHMDTWKAKLLIIASNVLESVYEGRLSLRIRIIN